MTVVVGTAGHIDHGKTTLIRALTGIDADRLPEERRRGMTIDLGYAHARLAEGRTVDFVDVPGHDRLVGNMLVGAGEVDAALVVVAADDGPRAQTLEHLELLDAIGVRDAVVAISKADLADRDRLGTVDGAVRRLLAATSLAAADVIAVSAATGVGIERLRAALDRLAGRLEDEAAGRRPDPPQPRLAVDRVFTIRGRGTVVTGTLRGGTVAAGDELRVVPGDRPVRVREVQVRAAVVERAGPGRTALNLAAVPADSLARGHALVGGALAPPESGAVTASDRLLVALRLPARLAGTPVNLPPDRARLRLHLGTDAVDARVVRSAREAVSLGEGAATAVLHLARPVAAAIGDPFVLRQPSPGATAAGGVVLDVAPPRGVSRRRATAERIAALASAVLEPASASASLAAARLALHGAVRVPTATPASVALAEDVARDIAAAAGEAVAARAASTPDDPGLPLVELRAALAGRLRRSVGLPAPDAAAAVNAVLDRLLADGSLLRRGDRLHPPGYRPTGPAPAVLAARERLVLALDVPAPPPLTQAARSAGCSPADVAALEREGRIVRLEADLAWSAAAWRRLAGLALARASAAPLTPASLRDATGTSRRYVMPLLEDLNRRGLLVRTPAGHRPGPRARSLDPGPVG